MDLVMLFETFQKIDFLFTVPFKQSQRQGFCISTSCGFEGSLQNIIHYRNYKEFIEETFRADLIERC